MNEKDLAEEARKDFERDYNYFLANPRRSIFLIPSNFLYSEEDIKKLEKQFANEDKSFKDYFEKNKKGK
jgi:hypothetical protein